MTRGEDHIIDKPTKTTFSRDRVRIALQLGCKSQFYANFLNI